MFNSFEVKNHIKYFIKDELGNYGSSPKHTVIIFDDEDMNSYIKDLSSKLSQIMLTIVKDYNHNDSKLFRYLPYGISNIELTQEEKEFVDLFDETPTDRVYQLN